MSDTPGTTPTNNTLPLGPTPLFVTRTFGVHGIDRIAVYRANGGYAALAKALTQFEPDALVDEVKKSGLRGRGGAASRRA